MTALRRVFFRPIAPALLGLLAGVLQVGPPVPPYLKGIDLTKPAQAAFADWPSKELRERPYWLNWSTLSLQRAVLFNQPIFLVVTVPWSRSAQRMASEALADPVVWRSLNHDYLSLLVSADRRPDLYARYGTGNWPAISLLLPDGSPMLSQANEQNVALPISVGPIDAKGVLFNLGEGRKYFDGWQNVLQGVSQVYEKRVDLEEATPGTVSAKSIDPVVRWLLGNIDAKYGGFGPAPKYALPGLMEWAFLRKDQGRGSLIEPARNTLKKLAASPLYDPRDGGFHRMAAAPDWGSIQYEKLLEPNVELIREIVFALKEADDPALRDALRSTTRFVTTVLARPSGGFHLAQVADPSSPDGGGYWKAAEADPAKAPPIDKLTLAGPNAMAGAALLRAGALLGDPALEAAGRAALDLVLARAVVPGRGVDHVIESEPDRGRYLVTQSKVAFALLDGYESTGDARYLAAANDVAMFVLHHMKKGKETAYRDHLPIGLEFGLLDMPLLPMQDNARFARVLVRLAALGLFEEGRSTAEAILGNYAGDLAVRGVRALEPGLAIDELLSDPLVVTLEGPVDDRRTQALRRAVLNVNHGWVVIKTAQGGAPAATLAWKGATRRATDPASLGKQLQGLVEGGAR